MNSPLTAADRDSALWARMRAYLEAQLALQRERNDNPQDERQAERIRGRIAQIKELLALDKPAP